MASVEPLKLTTRVCRAGCELLLGPRCGLTSVWERRADRYSRAPGLSAGCYTLALYSDHLGAVASMPPLSSRAGDIAEDPVESLESPLDDHRAVSHVDQPGSAIRHSRPLNIAGTINLASAVGPLAHSGGFPHPGQVRDQSGSEQSAQRSHKFSCPRRRLRHRTISHTRQAKAPRASSAAPEPETRWAALLARPDHSPTACHQLGRPNFTVSPNITPLALRSRNDNVISSASN